MGKMGVAGLAARLTHAGFDVAEVVEAHPVFDDRVLLRSGLAISPHEDGGFLVDLWHGFDPLSDECVLACGDADDVFSLTAVLVAVEPQVPALHAGLLGENRDVLGLVLARFAAWDGAPRVVESAEPVECALAVSMRGREFTAWLDGARLMSLTQVDAVLRQHWFGDLYDAPLTRKFFPFDVAGHRLTAHPGGLSSLSVEGVVRVGGEAQWFTGHYRRDEHGAWAESLAGTSTGGMLSAAEKARLAAEIGGHAEPFYRREFDAFARAHERSRERDLVSARNRAASADSREDRRRALHQERLALRDLAAARVIREGGGHREPWLVAAELERDGLAPGLLREAGREDALDLF